MEVKGSSPTASSYFVFLSFNLFITIIEYLTKEQKRLKNYDRVKKYWIKLKERAVKYLGGKCVKCGYNKCFWELDFHHRNANEKDFYIGAYLVLKWDLIEKELNKCDLLCANCHRETHYDLEYNI